MKISELKAMLTIIEQEHGDIKCMGLDEGTEFYNTYIDSISEIRTVTDEVLARLLPAEDEPELGEKFIIL